MKLNEAWKLLRYLDEHDLNEVHVVVPIPEGRKIGELMPGIKEEGFAAMVQSSARSDREIVVVGSNENT
jgi:hypothetical protein